MTPAENNLIDLFHDKRNLEIKDILLKKKMEELSEEIAQNSVLLLKANTISEIYNGLPIKIVTLHDLQGKTQEFWRIFPLFQKGKPSTYSANICKKPKSRAYNISIFGEYHEAFLPYSYTKEMAFSLAKEWVTYYTLPERESLFLKETANAPNSSRSSEITKIDENLYKRTTQNYPKIHRPSKDGDTRR